jgi:hypothetical protein
MAAAWEGFMACSCCFVQYWNYTQQKPVEQAKNPYISVSKQQYAATWAAWRSIL